MILLVTVYNKKTHDAFAMKFDYNEDWKVVEDNIYSKMKTLNWEKKDCYFFQRKEKGFVVKNIQVSKQVVEQSQNCIFKSVEVNHGDK